MNLQGSITELQESIAKLYLDLEQRFRENPLIRDLWSAMAHDMTQQKHSTNALPPSFWHQLKDKQHELAGAITEGKQASEKKGDQPLRSCFEQALAFEEATILKIYVPIIRKLRENWTEKALDFYIMVKAHLARITRVIQSFAGDPVTIQRSNLLLQRFEKEVQEPQVVIERKLPKVRAAQAAREKLPAKPQKSQKKAVARHAPAIGKREKTHHKRTKPLVEKIRLSRRRAQR